MWSMTVLISERLKAFPLRSEIRYGAHFTMDIQHYVEVLARAVWREREIRSIPVEEKK